MAFPADLTCFLSSVIFWLLDFFGVGVFVFCWGRVGRQCLGWMVLFVSLVLVLFLLGFSGGGLGFGFFGFFFAMITLNQPLLLMSCVCVSLTKTYSERIGILLVNQLYAWFSDVLKIL